MSQQVVTQRFQAPLDWSAKWLTHNPVFDELCQLFPLAGCKQWPQLGELNQWATGRHPQQYIDAEKLSADGRYYEAFIYETGQIPTRQQNWHDLFGALIWQLFPKTKALLNQLHITEIQQHGMQQRSKLRHKITLLDECGVVIACEPAARQHINWLRQHLWQQSFVQQRSDWFKYLKPVIFGHAIYEMATRPFIGFTAKCWFINVPAGFCQWSLTDAYSFLDTELREQIANSQTLLDNQQLSPLPLLGIPGWYNDNNQAGFYGNSDYFRPLRQR